MQPSEGKPACWSPIESLKLSRSRELYSYHTIIFWVPCRICSSTVSVNQLLKMYRHYCHTITLAGENVQTHQVFKVFLRPFWKSASPDLWRRFVEADLMFVCPDRIAKPMAERDILCCDNEWSCWIGLRKPLHRCPSSRYHAASWARTSPYSLGPYIFSGVGYLDEISPEFHRAGRKKPPDHVHFHQLEWPLGWKSNKSHHLLWKSKNPKPNPTPHPASASVRRAQILVTKVAATWDAWRRCGGEGGIDVCIHIMWHVYAYIINSNVHVYIRKNYIITFCISFIAE